jgi:hypothetical protein
MNEPGPYVMRKPIGAPDIGESNRNWSPIERTDHLMYFAFGMPCSKADFYNVVGYSPYADCGGMVGGLNDHDVLPNEQAQYGGLQKSEFAAQIAKTTWVVHDAANAYKYFKILVGREAATKMQRESRIYQISQLKPSTLGMSIQHLSMSELSEETYVDEKTGTSFYPDITSIVLHNGALT